MEDLRQIAKQIIEECFFLSLGTADESGVWVCDLLYINDDLNIYWLSHPDKRHSRAISKNPKVACTITLSATPEEEDIGLQIEGLAEEVNGELPEILAKYNLKRKKPVEQQATANGMVWYRLRPTKIEVIHQKLFGYEKRTFEP